MPGTRKLGKTTDQRMAMLRQQVTDFLDNGKMETTITRAKEIKPMAEKMITLGKKGDLAAYRQALSFITREDVANKLFKELAPSYAERNGGVGIAEIIVLLKAGIDLCSASCIISTAAGKRCLNAGQGLGIDGVHTGLCQVSHPACHFGAAAADMVQKTLQVAGNQNIHGR